jgi:hypothetical protein
VAGSNVFVDLDVGLIEVDDLNQWTTQVYGVGEIGPLADLSVSNISLRLIGLPVRAHGAASGNMQGEICALFYRFKSVGGFEYVADALISPVGNKTVGTHPGDSGTLWLTDRPDDKQGPRPIALQWGGQVFLDDTQSVSSYALVTFLSTVCNELDVTPLRDWNTGLPEYWGAVGHYGIATKACRAIRNHKLKRLMEANTERISYEIGDISKRTMAGLSNREFVPLADVPDMVWKIGPYRRGGSHSPEHANHFADMDRRLDPELAEGATLLEICDGRPENVAVGVWQRYYDAVKEQFPEEQESRGLLPFRVWQIYDAMVSYVKSGEVDKFVCAGGILAHYIGDSCQPLHISYMFNGDPDRRVTGVVRDRNTGERQEALIPRGTGVHSAYEDNMVDRHVHEIVGGVDRLLARSNGPSLVTSGHGAAVAVVELMQQTFRVIAPSSIVDDFVRVQDERPSARADAMWQKLGEDTIKVMADGCICLAQLWDSAWEEGGGDDRINSLGPIDEAILEQLYQNPEFLPSYTLNSIEASLRDGPVSDEMPRRAPRTRTGRRSLTPVAAD